MRASLPRESRGFTLLEMLIALAVLGTLLVSVLSITIETFGLVGDIDVDDSLKTEGQQAFDRIAELLRKTGWNTAAALGLEYPRVIAGGKRLEFRVLRDLDSNGFPFDAVTGDLEWGVTVYTIRLDADGTLRVYSGLTPVWHLGRFVDSVDFATIKEDASLQQNEIRVIIRTLRTTKKGDPLSFTLSGSVDMRN